MDFLQSLMVYMSLTFAAAVQGAPAPEHVPMPTVVPTAVVEMATETSAAATTAKVMMTQDTLAPTVVPTLPPAPTEVPEPTITPNKAYKTLSFGSKGNDVRALQQRLADLGYLTGNIDGAYGYQTRNAVMKFQELNGLDKDGVAGRSTQTRLFEDPAVIPNPERVTPSPKPTATPGPDGLIPLMEDPRSIWVDRRSEAALVNGEAVTNPVGVWLRGTETIVSLTGLANGTVGWTLTSSDAFSCKLMTEGYTVEAVMADVLAQKQKGNAYSDFYTVSVNGTTVEVKQGDLMQEEGVWYVTSDCLAQLLHGDVLWDEDEKTLIVNIVSADISQSGD